MFDNTLIDERVEAQYEEYLDSGVSCPVCGMAMERRTDTYKIGSFTVESHWYECPECGESFSDDYF